MRKAIVTALVLGLVAGAVALPAEAKKKKKKPAVLQPAESKFFLHWDTDGTPAGCGESYMNLVDSEGDSSCNGSLQPVQEVLIATEVQPAYTTAFPAREGVPLTIDASRKLLGEIVLRGTFTVDAYVELTLTGTVNGQEVELAVGQTESGDGLASSHVQGQQLPGPAAVLPVEIDMNKAFDKLEATSLTLTTRIRGVHRGGIDYEVNPSHIIIPTFIK